MRKSISDGTLIPKGALLVLLACIAAPDRAWSDSWVGSTGQITTDQANTKVGIGKTPSVALDVNGAAAISSTLGVTGPVSMTSTLNVTGNVFASGTGSGFWMDSPGTFHYGLFKSGSSLAFRSGSSSDFLTVSSAGQPAFSTPVTMSSTLGVVGVLNAQSRLNIGGAADNSVFALNVAGGAIATQGNRSIISYGYGMPGDPNFERISLIHTGSSSELRSERGGTGTARPLRLVVGGTTRYDITNSGAHTVTGPVSMSSTLDVTGNVSVHGELHTGTVVATNWRIEQAPDYVFDKGYDLAPLEEVESFVQKNKHLPEVPSAKEMKARGLDLVKMNFDLLKKVEELTLHAIRQEKEMKKQAEEIRKLKERL